MATRDPSPGALKVRWHKRPVADGTPSWYAEVGGWEVATAVMTGRSGVDDYPWDWHLSPYGETIQRRTGRVYGAADTLRSVKDKVWTLLRPDTGDEARAKAAAMREAASRG